MLVRILAGVLIFIILLATGCVAWLLFTPWAPQQIVRLATDRWVGLGKVSWEHLEGSFWSGVTVRHLEVYDPGFFPARSVVRVQALTLQLKGLTGWKDLIVGIENFRLIMPGRDNIVLRGRFKDGQLTANVYARSLELADVRRILMRYFNLVLFKGTCENIDLELRGTLLRPEVTGHFFVRRIIQNEYALEEVPARVDLNFKRGLTRWQTHGTLFLDGGSLRVPNLLVALKPGHLKFAGRPAYPELAVSGITRVGRTDITIFVTGPRRKPVLELSSDPSYPREQILFMLTTGKRWTGVSTMSGQDRMTPELASNFVDYLLFGGPRARWVRAVGLSDISVIVDDKKQGISVSKDITDRIEMGYDVEVGKDTQQQREITQRMGSEFHLTNKLVVGAQKEIKAAEDNDGRAVEPLDLPDDRFYMKYKTSF